MEEKIRSEIDALEEEDIMQYWEEDSEANKKRELLREQSKYEKK